MSRVWLDVADLAERWHTTTGAIHVARGRGRMVLPQPVRLGKKLLWDEADIEVYENALKETHPNG